MTSGIGKLKTKKIIEIENKIDHIIPFQCITFKPSRGSNGNKLNVANNEFTKLINELGISPEDTAFFSTPRGKDKVVVAQW